MKEFLHTLHRTGRLTESETEQLVESLVANPGTGASGPTDAQIGAYLMHTTVRDLDAAELIGAARCLRRHVVPVAPPSTDVGVLLDTCGTGGSGFDTFNTSTAVAFVCAGAGQPVAKHGNRAASSKSGSADVLESIGVTIDLPPKLVSECLSETGFCFMFAPLHHPATKRVAIIRRELGLRTIFNFLGPLVNPAGANAQLLGVSSERMLEPMADALIGLGTVQALVVRGEDGLDELSITGLSKVIQVRNGSKEVFEIHPSDFGLPVAPMKEICVGSPAESAEVLHGVLNGKHGTFRNLVILNAGAALSVCGKASSISEGIAVAEASIDQGHAKAVLNAVQSFSSRHA